MNLGGTDSNVAVAFSCDRTFEFTWKIGKKCLVIVTLACYTSCCNNEGASQERAIAQYPCPLNQVRGKCDPSHRFNMCPGLHLLASAKRIVVNLVEVHSSTKSALLKGLVIMRHDTEQSVHSLQRNTLGLRND
jgi:hypothetical protein